MSKEQKKIEGKRKSIKRRKKTEEEEKRSKGRNLEKIIIWNKKCYDEKGIEQK